VANVAKVAMCLRQGNIVTGEWVEEVVTWHVHAVDSHDPFTEANLTSIGLAATDWWETPGPHGSLRWGFSLAFGYTSVVWLNRVEVFRIQPLPELTVVVPGENRIGDFQDTEFEGVGVTGRQYPPQVCWMLRLATATDGRRATGRLFLPATDLVYDPLLGDTEPTSEERAWGKVPVGVRDWLGAMAANLAYYMRWALGTEFETVLAVYSRVDSDARAVTQLFVADFLRTQRRRAVMPSPVTQYDLAP
jgi:hypothetical protein